MSSVFQRYAPEFVVDGFEVAPRLRTLVFTGPYYPHGIYFPHNQIVELDMHLHCINRTSNPYLKLNYPALQSLTLTFILWRSDLAVFSSISTPNLKSLCIDFSRLREILAWPHRDFISFLSRPQPVVLHELVLRCSQTSMCSRNLIECLRHLPSLAKLKVLERHGQFLLTDDVFLALTHSHNFTGSTQETNALCPGLVELDIGGASDYNPDVLAQMVESRAMMKGTNLTNLQSLVLHESVWGERFAPHVRARLSALEEVGLRLHIES
ncbi:hypothetical protein H0H87_012799 [Tephrocybe sp. NHM501043]|nr:hypothetical protein H0H87_012799 [Tephrocybe sp. NHM501043]